jgi:hypothetical protein
VTKHLAALGRMLNALEDGRFAAITAEYREHMDTVLAETTALAQRLAAAVTQQTNDIEEIRDALDRLREHIASKWEGVKDAEPPIALDVIAALRTFARDYDEAGSHAKRKMLFMAFVGSFDPTIYREGWNRIFTAWARRLEPPHLQVLRTLLDQFERSKVARAGVGFAEVGRRVDGEDYPLLLELASIGLISMPGPNANGVLLIKPSSTAARFVEFLAEFDAEPQPAAISE